MQRLPGCAGWALVVVGVLAMLFLCNIAFRAGGQSETPGQAGTVTVVTLALMAVIAIVFIVPGLLLLILGKRGHTG
jgi:ABC-type transporter Mla maintaining outer membrane lipid asymmetry permease subunit MlaE